MGFFPVCDCMVISAFIAPAERSTFVSIPICTANNGVDTKVNKAISNVSTFQAALPETGANGWKIYKVQTEDKIITVQLCYGYEDYISTLK